MTESEKIIFIELTIAKLFKKTVNLKPSDNLLDLGIDSLEIVELQMYYEEATGIEIDAESQLVTVQDLMVMMK